jgi:predicted nucleic acid-binding protein
MCVIIDASVATEFFCAKAERYAEVLDAVIKGRCCIYYGGQLRREYAEARVVLTQVLMLDQAGRAKVLPDKDIDALTELLKTAKACKSDDPHIIALATISNSRVLCTKDKRLQVDFTNANLLANPRGNIYKNSSHRNLIKKHCHAC